MAATHKETGFQLKDGLNDFKLQLKRGNEAIKVSSLDERQLKFTLWAQFLIFIRFAASLRGASLG